jgi:hypothetical protein
MLKFLNASPSGAAQHLKVGEAPPAAVSVTVLDVINGCPITKLLGQSIALVIHYIYYYTLEKFGKLKTRKVNDYSEPSEASPVVAP